MKVVIVTGGFDPIHSGHISYFRSARLLGDILIVGLNSDEWLTRKKGKSFMEWKERKEIIQELRMVDRVISFDDSDNTGRDAIHVTRRIFPNAELIFANGGDRAKENTAEQDIKDDKLSFAFGVGGTDKKNSSSWILNNFMKNKEKI